jgi:integrase
VPTFAGYVPVVSATVTDGTRKAYGSYWNRVVEQWGTRRLDEPTPSEIKQLMAYVRANVVPRRNARGGRSAAENLIAALRCPYKRAEDDGFIDERNNPARKVDKPRRLPSTRRAVADTRLAEINQIAATTGDDPELDILILRLHAETACRRGGALALRPADLDPDQCLVLLREKGETVRRLNPRRHGTTRTYAAPAAVRSLTAPDRGGGPGPYQDSPDSGGRYASSGGQIFQLFPLPRRTCAPGWSACTALSRAMTSSMGRPESITAIGLRTATGGGSPLCEARARICRRASSSHYRHQGHAGHGPSTRPTSLEGPRLNHGQRVPGGRGRAFRAHVGSIERRDGLQEP